MSHRRAITVASLCILMLVLLASIPASAATFAALPPGEQKIVRALYEAQPASSPTFKPLTLNQIAARKGSGQGGWGQVFKDMKAQGYVSQKNLGAVVSAYEHRHPPSSSARADKGRDGEAKGVASSAREDRGGGSAASPGSGMGHGGGTGPGGGAGHGGGKGR
jgi:hypothetical protein